VGVFQIDREETMSVQSGVARLAALVLLLVCTAPAARAALITLGDQDFVDGQFILGSNLFDAASVGEPAPFDKFQGVDFLNDINSQFTAIFTFTYPPGPVTAASLTLGIFDGDSAGPSNQVKSFTLDGLDLTAELNAVLEAKPSLSTQYTVYTLVIPGSALPALADGSATFSLTLQGPTPGQSEFGNGYGLDFASLDITNRNGPPPEIPLPAALWPAAAMACGILQRRLRPRTTA
jgi:hypothetical protein